MKQLGRLFLMTASVSFMVACSEDDSPAISQQELLQQTWHLKEIKTTNPEGEIITDRLDNCRRQTQLTLSEKTFVFNGFETVATECKENMVEGDWNFSQRKITFQEGDHKKEYTLSRLSPREFILEETLVGEVETELTKKVYMFNR